MRIDSSGRVGIGTQSPLSELHLHGPTSGVGPIFNLTNDTGDCRIFFGQNTSTGSANAAGQIRYNVANNTLGFYTNLNERMRIDSSGRLLVGVSSSYANSGADDLQVGNNSSSTVTGITLGSTVESSIRFADAGNASAGLIEYNHASDSMRFYTNGTNQRMRILNNGQTGILFSSTYGQTSYSSQGSSSSVWPFWSGHSSTDTIGTGGTVTFRVASNGTVQNITGTIGTISDAKLKENIVDAGSQWEDLKAVRFRKYNLKKETGYDTHTQLGVIAQELEEVCPGLVEDIPDIGMEGNDMGTTTKNVKTSILTLKALVALQEAMERIETLEQRLTDAGL
jgi:hypothetical protein